MKKLLACILSAALCGAAIVGLTACNNEKGGQQTTYTVYAPDGAPALALASFPSDNAEIETAALPPYRYERHVVAANTIAAQVSGANPAADFCVLPVNVAASLLGTGETYQMLGTVTNGNMYFLTTGTNAELTADNLDILVGKTVGVVQLANVPGLTFQAVLSNKGISYQTLGNDNQPVEDKVNLKAFADATTVSPAAGCDYYLCPEPAVSAKIKGTNGALKYAGSLQELHGGSYPQAVLVAKKSVSAAAIAEVISYFEGSADFLKSASAETVLKTLDSIRTEGLDPAFTANNLNATVIERCSVYFTKSAECKAAVNAFLAELIAVNPEFTKTVSDAFYYA